MESIDSGSGETGEGFVTLDDASDEDLDAFISGQTKLPDGDDANNQPGLKENATPPSSSDKDEADKALNAEELNKKVESLSEELNRLRTINEQTERFAKRRSTEIGDLRKEMHRFASENEQLKSLIQERALENPLEAFKLNDRLKANEEALVDLSRQEQEALMVDQSRNLVSRVLQPEEFDVDAMAETFEADGLTPDFIAAFKANPFAFATGEALVATAKRAKAEKLIRQMVPFVKKVMEERDHFKSLTSVENVASRLDVAARQAPQISANSGVSRGVNPDTFDMGSLSDSELEAFLAKASR